MAYQIEPTRAEDCLELGQFLARGFGLPGDAPQAAVDVLEWKYLRPRAHLVDEPPRSWIARSESGRIIGHIGSDFTTLRIVSGDSSGSFHELPAQHIVDWLAAKDQPGVGAALMRRAHATCPLQYALAATPIARKVALRLGYADFVPVPIFKRVVRPSIDWQTRTDTVARSVARTARDVVDLVRHRPRRSSAKVAVRSVERFGDEVDAITRAAAGPLLFTGRHAANLNTLLSYPRPGLSGWLVHEPRDEHALGFAVLSLFRHGGRRVGKIAELFLPTRSISHWHAAYVALARILARQGAQEIRVCAGTPWEGEALALAGFRHAFDAQLIMRNHERTVPTGVPFHIGLIEADYAYNP